MSEFSVVIVCRNEADTIGRTLESLQGLTDDIIVYDNGSTDDTQAVIRRYGVRLEEGAWEGFGKTKQKATALARYDWVLSLDADESIDADLKQSLLAWQPEDEFIVYDLSFRNYLGDVYLKYGEWGGDHHIRLFNRTRVQFDDAPVHETLLMPAGTKVRRLKGFVLHRTMKDIEEYARKMQDYAFLNAEKYFRQGRKSSWFAIRLSPLFTFMNYYILKLGILDGQAGYICAKMTAWYTFLKYARLKELEKQSKS